MIQDALLSAGVRNNEVLQILERTILKNSEIGFVAVSSHFHQVIFDWHTLHSSRKLRIIAGMITVAHPGGMHPGEGIDRKGGTT